MLMPLTVHTAGVLELSTGVRPELAVGATTSGPPVMTWSAGWAKVIVWPTEVISKERETGVAAPYVASPACVAVTVHVPIARKAMLIPLTEHTAGVPEA